MERILVGHCVRLVSLLSPFVSALLCCSPLHVSQLRSAVSASRLQSWTLVSQLWAAVSAPLVCNPLHLSRCVYICLPALEQSFTFVSQLWAAVPAFALQSYALALNLHLSPNSDCCVRLCLAILYICPCNPLRLSPTALDCCVRLKL